MDNKNNKTFADRAKMIERKFSRRKFDKIEERDFHDAMERLMDEQEEYRRSHGMMEENSEQYALGDYLKPMDAQLPYTLDTSSLAVGNPINSFSALGSDGEGGFDIEGAAPYISGGASILGNILAASLNKKPKQVVAPTVTPRDVNLTPLKRELSREATTTRNIVSRNLRNAGANTGQYLSNIGAASAGIQGALSKSLADIYGQEELSNVGAANRANELNASNLFRSNMINSGLDKQHRDEQIGLLQGSFNTIPQVMRDVNLQKADTRNREIYDRLLNYLGTNYGISGNFSGNDPFKLYLRNNQ